MILIVKIIIKTSFMPHFFLSCFILFFTTTSFAVEVQFQKVTQDVYVHIGELGQRSTSNEGLNANIGLVLTPEGAVLIDSGATFKSAMQIHEAVKKITNQPIKWVINTGGQDHRWLGNGYFLAQGAQIIAQQNAIADMKNRGGEHLAGLSRVLGDLVNQTKPTLPNYWIKNPDESLNLGGVLFELKHRGGAHTPGDMLVWLPAKKIMFSGDVVYVNRMLGVLPVSRTQTWLATFAEIEKLAPQHIIPGHGQVCDLKLAKADTQAYLLALTDHMKKAIDNGLDISAAIQSFNSQPFSYLLNSAELIPGNSSRTYLEIESQ